FSSRRRHTRSKRDWSSDVCSSDLDVQHRMVAYTAFIHRQPEDDMTPEQFVEHVAALEDAARIEDAAEREMATTAADAGAERSLQIGRAACRARGVVAGLGVVGQRR